MSLGKCQNIAHMVGKDPMDVVSFSNAALFTRDTEELKTVIRKWFELKEI